MTKYFNLDNPAPFISARSWIMMNLNTSEVMFAKQEKIQRQVASLTKVMTAHVVLELLSEFGLDWNKVDIRVLQNSTKPHIGGTSAQLLPGDKLTVRELMFGMMLPSGNDAAQTLAIFFGNLTLLHEKKGRNAEKTKGIRSGFCVNPADANINEADYPDILEETIQTDGDGDTNGYHSYREKS